MDSFTQPVGGHTRGPISNRKSALIVVDLQADFLSGGALAVPGATHELVDTIAAHITGHDWTAVALTMDMHPKNHCSFVAHGGVWPEHCVRGTPGCKLDPAIAAAGMLFNETHGHTTEKALDPALMVVHKRQDPNVEQYSAFGTRGNWTALGPYLMRNRIEDVYICGIATEYCVKATIEDAVRFGFRVHVIEDLCASVEPTNTVFADMKQQSPDVVFV